MIPLRTIKLPPWNGNEPLEKWDACVTCAPGGTESVIDGKPAGCRAGSGPEEELVAVHKKYNIQKDRDFRASVHRIHVKSAGPDRSFSRRRFQSEKIS